MSELIPNSFSSYNLTEKEVLQGSILSTLQKQVLQNQLAAIAEEKLRLDYDPAKILEFVQQDAYKRGQIDLLSFILDASDAAERALYNPNYNPEEEV
jgi:hypothetical protein